MFNNTTQRQLTPPLVVQLKNGKKRVICAEVMAPMDADFIQRETLQLLRHQAYVNAIRGGGL